VEVEAVELLRGHSLDELVMWNHNAGEEPRMIPQSNFDEGKTTMGSTQVRVILKISAFHVILASAPII